MLETKREVFTAAAKARARRKKVQQLRSKLL
jgi:hypothetical protein